MAGFFSNQRLRKRVFFFVGLFLLMFAGYAITFRARRVQVRKAVSLLGDEALLAGKPAAFRLIGWDLKWGRPLAISRVDLELQRSPGPTKRLARLYPAAAIVDLNIRVPDWPAGQAKLVAKVETELGTAVIEGKVWLNPQKISRLRLSNPSVELDKKPILLQQGPASLGSEAGSQLSEMEPSNFVFFPVGRKLSSTFSSRLLVRVLDRQGRPLAGELSIDESKTKKVDPHGFAEVIVSERPSDLKLTFIGQTGGLAGAVSLRRAPAQVDIATSAQLAAAGDRLMVHLRTLSASAMVYLDAWWQKGWCFSGQTKTENGQANLEIQLPAGIEGPLVIRARLDPFGQGLAQSDAMLLVGSRQAPSVSQGFDFLRQLETAANFWAEVGRFESGTRPTGLLAVLSRVTAPEGVLPVLADGQEAEELSVTKHKQSMIRFGLWAVGLVSGLAFLIVAVMLIGASLKTDRKLRKQRLTTACICLVICGLVLAAGWAWLYWITRGILD